MEKIEVPYKDIRLSDGSPNEEFLAALRSRLKALEEKGGDVLICPVAAASECKDVDAALALTVLYVHCARRIKDCAAVKGFAVPAVFEAMERGDELSENFKAELLKKHPQYVFE